MPKPLKIPFRSLYTFKDPNVDRLQTQINLMIESLRLLQGDLFVIERPIYSKQYIFTNRLLYQDDGETGVTSNPADFRNPVPIGIGRSVTNDQVLISTMLHFDERIKVGQRYRFNADGTYSENNASDPHLLGISDGVGKVLLENL